MYVYARGQRCNHRVVFKRCDDIDDDESAGVLKSASNVS